MNLKFDADYWDARFRNLNTPWDLGRVSRPMKDYIDQLSDRSVRILVPGCGHGHEINYLLALGFTNVTCVDISRTALANVPSHPNLTTYQRNFFDLEGEWDLVLEQTFFCALHPDERPAYVRKMVTLLPPGGRLSGVLFEFDRPGGPPFGGHRDEYQRLFETDFEIRTLETCYNSEPRRPEVFIRLVRNQ